MALSLVMTPYQRLRIIFEKWFRFTSTAIGLNVLDKDFKLSLPTFLVFLLAISTVIFSVYTMFSFDVEMFFKATTCLSLGLQACCKIYTIATTRSEVVFLSSYIENIYVVNEKKPSKNIKNIMDECSSHNFFITGALYTLYILCVIMFLLYPILVFAMFRMKEPWLPVFIPGIDFNTKEGFVITSILHYIILYLAGIGFGFVDAMFFNLVFNVLIMSELQCNQLSTLNEELAGAKPSESMTRIRLSNFFLMNMEMEKYVELIDQTFYLMIFIQIMTTSLSTTLIVYIIMTMSWYPSYFLAVCLVFQVFLFCALGTVIDVANDKLEHAILQTNYYLLPLDLQRDFKFMINIVQKAKFLKTGGTKLDVTLFVLIMRKIYTFIMLLRTMI